MRNLTPLDHLLVNLDQGIRTVFGKPQVTERPDPAKDIPESPELSTAEQKHVARLMRINHTGEVCAQALYQGQALTAKLPEVGEKMHRAAAEENDHLDWCEKRVHELGEHTSLFNPFWYVSSFAIGAAAGVAGDKWSLGFVVETERQVVCHLEQHLSQLPKQDAKTEAILKQMKIDEKEHATTALNAGGAPLPAPVKFMMHQSAKLMTKTTYWI